jgi:hypothetical protein
MRKWLIAAPAVLALACALVALRGKAEAGSGVRLIRVPNGGIQPQVAVGPGGIVHMVYFEGDPAHGNIDYVRSTDWGVTFSSPVRVNSEPESAVALGTIRGAHLAVGENGRVHVAWNGSVKGLPKGPLNLEMPRDSPYNGSPMLYTRLDDAGTSFEKQRNLMKLTFGLDGGGSVAADQRGNVYVAWHGKRRGDPAGEAGRRVWIARSRDGGKTFAPETVAFAASTGACGCCGLSVFTDKDGTVYILYRTAREMVHRDIYLLVSKDGGRNFRGRLIDPWTIGACPMTSMTFAQGPGFVDAAWQTRTQVYYATIDPETLETSKPVPAPGTGKLRKYPSLAVNARGDTILVWTDGTGWGTGGSLAWQVFNRQGRPLGKEGRVSGLPAWSFGAVFARPGGGFIIVY